MSPGCAIVTEGSRGLGLGIAAALAETGRPVVIAACNPQDLRNAAAELEAERADVLAWRPDITDRRAVGELVRRVVERFARIDVLVNNAGGRSPEPAPGCRDPGNPRFGNG
jgi:NAD(P)-dependent dehydrogenase (short-subunit alcohol dehydrogenase family)